jgi:kynurenine formamidase
LESNRVQLMPKIIDLTLTLSPALRGVEFEQRHTVERDGWNTRTLHLYSHCGTHMDAPLHFAAGEGTVDRIPPAHWFLPAWVADLTGVRPRELIAIEHLGPVAGKIAVGEGLLLRTGWSRHVADPQRYRDELPRVSLELAEWCVRRGVRLLGVEPPSVADVNNLAEVTAVHRTLLAAEIVIVEGLTNLEALRQQKILFCAAPLKIAGGDGSPCRAFAIELDSSELLALFSALQP